MRRQRLLRISSAQNLCIFCAGRLGLGHPLPNSANITRTRYSSQRDFGHSRRSTQSSAAVPTDAVRHASHGEPSPQWSGFDPTSTLSVAEQKEKAARMRRSAEHEAEEQRLKQDQLRQSAEREAEEQRLKQERIWKNMEAEKARQASQEASRKEERALAAHALMAKQEAMRQKSKNDLQAEGRNGAQVNKRSNAQKQADRPQNRKEQAAQALSRQVFRGAGRSDNPPIRPNPLALPSFESPKGAKHAQTSPDRSGWGASGTVTMPLEYGDGSNHLPITVQNSAEPPPARDGTFRYAQPPSRNKQQQNHNVKREQFGMSGTTNKIESLNFDNSTSDSGAVSDGNRAMDPQRTASSTQFQPFNAGNPPSHQVYGDTGYQAVPFDPSQYQPRPLASRDQSSDDWTHLRRRRADGPTSAPGQRQPPRPRIDPLDDGWVDRVFQDHRINRQQTSPKFASVDQPRFEAQSIHGAQITGRRCARCGEIGHIARQCTREARTLRCYECGQTGHTSKDCPAHVSRADKQASSSTRREDVAFPKGSDFEMPPSRRGSDGANEPARPSRGSAAFTSFGPFGAEGVADRNSRVSRDTNGVNRRTDFAERGVQKASRSVTDAGAELLEQRIKFIASPEAEEEERRSARRSKWADTDDDTEQIDTPSSARRPTRRLSQRSGSDEADEGEGARDEHRARKSARQKERNAKKGAEVRAAKQRRDERKAAGLTPIQLPEFISVQQLAQALGERYEPFVQRLEALGYEDVFPGKIFNSETSGMIAMEYSFEPNFDTGAKEEEERDLRARAESVDKEFLPARPPVVTIMGHVDHGKTTILDYLRKSSVAAGEAGGITQHIGAFSVSLASSGRTITFLDTPGHAAFLAMRQRGANVTDIVILVVAADDSVKPQTLEAIKHAKAAGVPMIVAVNKVDKPEADIQRVKADLARHDVEIEDFGGETQVVCVSGKTGQGMDELEESVVTLSEILDHRAETDGPVEGWVLEATTKKAGRVATVLVRRGTLKPGAVIVAGRTWARIRTLRNEGGQLLNEIGPGMPVEIDGWKDQPVAGDEVLQAPSEQKASSVVEYRHVLDERNKTAQDTEAINEARRLDQEQKKRERAAELAAKRASAGSDEPVDSTPMPQEDPQQTGQISVPFIIKADVSGSAEAVSAYILSVSSPLVTPTILQSGVGAVHESDIDLASAAAGHIIAFNLPTNNETKGAAEARGVKVLENNIIYRVLDDVKAVLEDKLPPVVTQKVTGEADIAANFEIGIGGRKKMWIAGCKIRNGVLARNAHARVLRGGEKIYDGLITSLKNVKKDVQEMRKGTECGVGFDSWENFEVGDQIQTYEIITEKRKL